MKRKQALRADCFQLRIVKRLTGLIARVAPFNHAPVNFIYFPRLVLAPPAIGMMKAYQAVALTPQRHPGKSKMGRKPLRDSISQELAAPITLFHGFNPSGSVSAYLKVLGLAA